MHTTEERKLNIAMICDPVGEYKAGAIVSALRFGERLQKQGHKVIFIGATAPDDPTHGTIRGMKVYRFRSIPLPKSGGWRLAFPTMREIQKILIDEQIDVVHIILPMSGAVVAVRAAKSLSIPIVAHSHSQPENLFMTVPFAPVRAFLGRLWNKYLAWLYGKAHSIIYPSKLGHQLLHHLTEEGKPSYIVSNGVDVSIFKPVDTADFHERFNLPREAFLIVYVGRLFPEKSVDTLIKALPHIRAQHPHVHTAIVGMGYLRPSLEALAQELDIEEHVTFLTLDDDDKLLAYNAADVFISPSFAELEGMTVLEAMASGKPIIVPDAPMNAARFFVTDNGRLFEVANHKDLAEKALEVIGDAELRAQMGAASLARSREYDINASVAQLVALYRSIISE